MNAFWPGTASVSDVLPSGKPFASRGVSMSSFVVVLKEASGSFDAFNTTTESRTYF
jgi:hypothetical protein